MSERERYAPGPARGAEARRVGDQWTLIIARELHQPPAKVWRALTEPELLREWAPFDSDRTLGIEGAAAKLSTVGMPTPQVTETRVTRAESPTTLEYTWGDSNMRWELEPLAGGDTRLTLSANISERFAAMGAAGWHICLDVLDRLLASRPIGRIIGAEAMKFGWQRLYTEYATQLGIEASSPAPPSERPS